MHINDLFEKRAISHPLSKAIICNNQSISYQSLDEKANQFCRYLRSTHSIKKGDVVGLLIQNKSIDLFVVMLGILKAGAAYQIFKTNHLNIYSPELKHVKCLIGDFQHDADEYMHLDKISSLIQGYDPKPFAAKKKLSNAVAYLVSTSGTTGQPKTISITHKNLIATYESWKTVYELNSDDRHLQMANVSFDVFTGDWVRALCSGGTLVLCPKQSLLSPEQLYSLIEKHRITIAEFVPAVLRPLMSYVENAKKSLSFFRMLICGSDTWYFSEYKKLFQLCEKKSRIINSYGVAETTIDATFYEWTSAADDCLSDDSIIPIGKAFPHVVVKVIDSNGKEVNMGEEGEIYIGGEGVSKNGYFNNSELTKEKFVAIEGEKGIFYRTGDVGKYLSTGNILFLGRNNLQFNINAQRVDFLSVESVLLQHKKIKSAVVIPNNFRKPYLEAFLVLHFDVDLEDLTRYLSIHLPSYAIPRYFYEVNDLVLNENNKIVRKKSALSIIRKINRKIAHPKTKTQRLIREIWKKVLQCDSVSITDDFNLMGGTSIEYTQLVDELNSLFHAKINVCGNLKTIAEMSNVIDASYKRSPYMHREPKEMLL